ncbi:MAG TPA: c-type cytochrome [Puia sp.]|nr:c-type cytochrome [Puia sp.]
MLLILAAFFTTARTSAQDGRTLFQSNCAQCHNPIKVVTGPALKGVTERVPDQKILHAWIRNNQQVLASGNTYFNNLYDQYGRTPMNVFPNLSDGDIDAILRYVENYAEPMARTNTSTNAPASQEDHTVLYGIVTFILACFVAGLYLVNLNLKRLADEKRGLPPAPHIPFYRNKYYLVAASLVLFFVLGWWLVQAGIGLGRSQGYQPVQPIFFSHRIHAGLNQIPCLYCHGNAWDSKQATVPSPNICMNCHAAISDYHGEKLTREDGSRVDPNQEIQRLYSHTGYDPKTGRYTRPGTPIEWVRIHNLPDLVYFSHAQHVRAGKVQCQTCHGPVQEMDEVRQVSDLSMGWCINCHRTTRVDFPDSARGVHGNNFYTLYKTFSRDLRAGRMDSVTVEDIGGTECQKCHY